MCPSCHTLGGAWPLVLAGSRPSALWGLCLHCKGPTQMDLLGLRDTPLHPPPKPGRVASGFVRERGENFAFH